MDILLIIISSIFMVIGLLGCILPALPGPPISYVGFLLLHFTDKIQFSTLQIVVLLVAVVIAQVLDYFIPIIGSKYVGGTKWGSWGAFIGSVIGLSFMPMGLLLGPFLGALIGELLGGGCLKMRWPFFVSAKKIRQVLTSLSQNLPVSLIFCILGNQVKISQR